MKVMSLILHSKIKMHLCFTRVLNRMYSRISEDRARKLFEFKHNMKWYQHTGSEEFHSKIDACIIKYLEFTLQIEFIL